MQNDMRDRLKEMLNNIEYTSYPKQAMKANAGTQFTDYALDCIVAQLIANGVIVLDMNVISPKNRPLITHFANMPLNDVLDIIKADVVPVVRCKDCKFYYCADRKTRLCTHKSNLTLKTALTISREHYCSYGERKENK